MFCSRQAGHRFGEHIERVMPLVVQYSREEDDELREYCLQAFEAFVHRCPKEITPHIHTVSCQFVVCQKYFFELVIYCYYYAGIQFLIPTSPNAVSILLLVDFRLIIF